ncbi:MAG: hypothetical protein AB1921_05325 [Thermodesulfobacteriota bacterium]
MDQNTFGLDFLRGLTDEGYALPPAAMDRAEQAEREQAAGAYALENERHFVDYARDMMDSGLKAERDLREMWLDCYRVYQEKPPKTFAGKQAWQAKIVVPKPFTTVQIAAATVRQAFTPDFLTVTDSRNPKAAGFWQKLLSHYLAMDRANFPLVFADATVMALATGISMEMIPVWEPGAGVKVDLVEPWKIIRDPDAPYRDSQGGLFWAHREWVDYHTLRLGEQKGRYKDVAKARDVSESNHDPMDPFMTREAIAERKGQVWERSRFRTMLELSEFWGQVLSPRGELLLPRAWFTVGGGRLISDVKAAPYRSSRWPGSSFSPVPDLLRYGGRGLIQGVIDLWEALCSLFCLHMDALNWIVNPPYEINADGLYDPGDLEMWPGKPVVTKTTVNGQQVLRVSKRPDTTGAALANMQNMDQFYQRGTMVPDVLGGNPGWRSNITYREQAQHLQQSRQPFSLMGANLEAGAVAAIKVIREMIEAFVTPQELAEVFTPEELQEYGVGLDARGLVLPQFSGSLHVSGVTHLMKQQETLSVIMGTIVPMAERPAWQALINRFKVAKAIEVRTNLTDEGLFATEEQAQAAEAAAADAAKASAEDAETARLSAKLHDLLELHSQVKDLNGRMDEVERGTRGDGRQ